jgi:HD-like signal output (HDOD) protein
MSNVDIDNLLATQEFATLPPITMKVLSLLENDEDVDIRALSKIIEKDASLTLKLIRAANSPLFAVQGEVASVHQVIVTLGLNRVTNIALGISIFSKFMYSKNEKIKEILEKYWWHTSSTGTVSKSLAKRLGFHFKEQEFIGGLLHDIGKLAILQYDAELFNQITDLIENEKMKDFEAEKEVLGFDHTDIGAGISKLWKLQKDLSMALQFHTKVAKAPPESQNLVSVVSMANMLCYIWDAGFYEGFTAIDFEATDEWKIIKKHLTKNKDVDFEEITFALEQDYQNSKTFLDIMQT